MPCFLALNHLYCHPQALPLQVVKFRIVNKKEGRVALSENACYD